MPITQLRRPAPPPAPNGQRGLLRAVLPRIREPVRRVLTVRRLLLADLALCAALAVLGLGQAFVLHTPSTTATATALTAARPGYVDAYRSAAGNGHLWLTAAAAVRVDLPGGAADRVLLDAPPALRPGDRITVHIAADSQQVRRGPLPGPAVLPRGQGAALLLALIAAVPLTRRAWHARRAAAGPEQNPARRVHG